ncbi:MAG: hypothetical protein KKB81_05705 [Candidatus Margulisbacteria bacterium]|nr:hypothetical protein [Candidatus Margulisiibacteriota bacterium]MBU1021859.1 hypothetical protein [Candidatus Margulisiibacteriota bacterium]MBU1729018.1 hypothetical protein [Candidatus Margulisiibacteriota bacterium]MBU1954429.1 hypothetical protein [Candidatus Margulisiibacteriota bacterium]
MKKILMIGLLLLVNSASFALDKVSTEQLNAIIKGKPDEIVIIDVRNSDDFNKGSIPNAINIPIGFIPDEYTTIPKAKELYVICYGGKNSRTAIYALQSLGIKNPMYNVEGGMTEWAKTYPIVISANDIIIEQITARELKKIIDSSKKYILIDMRAPTLYQQEHIPTAILKTFRDLSEQSDKLDVNKTIILYCGGIGCDSSVRAAQMLAEKGFPKIKTLYGEFKAWQHAGYPIAK